VLAGDLPSLRALAPSVPDELEGICARALRLSPDDRYPTAALLEADLEAYLTGHTSRPADRDIGSALRKMFADDRSRMQAVVEAQLRKKPNPADTELPTISPPIGGSGSTGLSSTSSLPSDESIASLPDTPSGLDRFDVDPVPPRARSADRTRAVAIASAVTLQVVFLVAVVMAVAWAWGGTKRRGPGGEEPVPSAAVARPAPPVAAPARQVQGISESEVLCGMSAAFSGPSRELGNRMKLGVDTAFSLVNEQGGVAGRKLRLLALDDGYEGARAGDNMRELLDERKVFAIIGNVGTPTAQVAVPYTVSHKTIFFGAFTGSKLLRQEPPDRYVFNYRASYEEETAKMVHYLVDARRIAPASIVVFAQHDGYGDAGFDGVAKTMRKYGRGDADILRVNYERNTIDVEGAVRDVVKYHDSGHRVAAVIMVATYKAAAKFIQKIKDKGFDPRFLNVSFVGSNALLDELKELGPAYAPGVIITQVVPPYESGATGVLRYREALNRYHPDQQPDFVSLEGYVVGTLFAEGLQRAGRDPDTEKLVDALESIHDYDMGMGTIINFGASEHQGSHKVWGTAIDLQGHFVPFDME
jgi:branched-chain amino acid transport system substrate-binding protein